MLKQYRQSVLTDMSSDIMIVIITDQGFQVILSGDTPSVQQSQIISDKTDKKYYQH